METPNVNPRADHLLVWIDVAAADRTESGLYIPDWQPGDKDATKAEVVAVPLDLSRERPLEFANMDGRRYHYSDLRDLPRLGETVYLRPNTFKPELEYPGYPGVFLIALDRVVALGRKGRQLSQQESNFAFVPQYAPDELLPFQGLLLCDEVWGDDVRQREDGVRERFAFAPRSPTDERGFDEEIGLPFSKQKEIVTEVNPLPIPFTLRVLYSGVPLHGQENVVKPGDVITAHRMLFAYHRVIQEDIIDDTGPERMMWQPPKIVIEGHTYAVIPRAMVMAVLASA